MAEEVQDKGFKRVVDAITPALITATAEKVASGSTLMTEAQKSQVDKIIITYNIIQFKRSETHTDAS